jgi:opacity protein-like surface antigen
MLKRLLGLIVFMCSGLSLVAQVQVKHWEIYGGYQYLRIDTGYVQTGFNLLREAFPAVFPPLTFNRHQNLNGWTAGLQENVNSWFGGVIEASGGYRTTNSDVTSLEKILGLPTNGITYTDRTKLRTYLLMGGPQFTYRRMSKLQPFARVLVGAAFVRNTTALRANNATLSPPGVPRETDNDAAYGGGVGTDVNVTRLLGVRLSADYIRSNLFKSNQDNLRGGAALVFRFGGNK